MGSLTSRPSVPRYQQPVYITTPVPTPAPVAVTPSVTETEEPQATDTATSTTQDDTQTTQGAQDGTSGLAATQGDEVKRGQNLLSRSRGRLSTIRTGFSGILTQAAQGSAAKTLLGE